MLMLIQEVFRSLQERIEQIGKTYADADAEQREELDTEIAHIRQLVDAMEKQCGALRKELDNVKKTENEDDLQPSDVLATIGTLTKETEYEFRRGQGYFDLFLFDHAQEEFESIVRHDPDLEVARLYLAYAHLFCDKDAESQRQFHILKETTEHPALLAMASHGLGYLTAKGRNYDQAVQHFKEAIQLFPYIPDTSFNLALIHYLNEDYTEACQLLESHTRQVREDWEARLLLVRCCEQNRQEDRAVREMERLLEECREPAMLEKIAHFFEMRQRYDQALTSYRLILEQHHDAPWVWHGLGWCRWFYDRSPQSILCIQRAISLAPREWDYLFSLGWIRLQEGRKEDAESYFRFILQKDPYHPLAAAGMAQRYTHSKHWREVERYLSVLSSSNDEKVQKLAEQIASTIPVQH